MALDDDPVEVYRREMASVSPLAVGIIILATGLFGFWGVRNVKMSPQESG